MKFFDLHCDTVSKAYDENKTLYNNSYHIDLNKADNLDSYTQCMAIWIKNELKGNDAFEYFSNVYNLLKTNILENKNSSIKLIPTVENSSALANKLENVKLFSELGVRMMTLTWNGENDVGSGTYASNSGITSFGKDLIIEMNKHNIIIDISHASEHLFWDVCKNTNEPIVASHSNAYSICQNERNLKDEQIKEIISRKGLIGINFYNNFLNNDSDKANINDIARNIEYMLNLGAENTLAFGSDFDGCDIPDEIGGIWGIEKIYSKLENLGFSKILLDKIFWENANSFFN